MAGKLRKILKDVKKGKVSPKKAEKMLESSFSQYRDDIADITAKRDEISDSGYWVTMPPGTVVLSDGSVNKDSLPVLMMSNTEGFTLFSQGFVDGEEISFVRAPGFDPSSSIKQV